MRPEKIKQIIESNLKDSTAIIEGNDGKHYTALVVSPEFIGMNRLQKQRVINNLLARYLDDGSLHAISIKTLTPEEWHTQHG